MAYERQIISHEPCPRCNAIADVRRDNSDELPAPLPGVVTLTLVCPKCGLHRAAGMTTEEVLNLRTQERKLFDALQGNKSQTEYRRIRAKLRDVRNRIQRAELGV